MVWDKMGQVNMFCCLKLLFIKTFREICTNGTN